MSAPTPASHAAARADALPADDVVVDSVGSVDLIDRTHHQGTRGAGERTQGGADSAGAGRAVPYFCPFCAEEDLRPFERASSRHSAPELSDENDRTERAHGVWHCRSCLRTFSVRFHGLAGLDPASAYPAPLDAAPANVAALNPAALDPAPANAAALDPAPLDPAPLNPSHGGPA
jgi:hypothetical protein